MRNGNPILPQLSPRRQFCSYPTYEEWKPIFSVSTIMSFVLRSYPTYEEWKQTFFSSTNLTKACSYPTYEEWKPKYSVNNRFPLKMFLSYL